VGAVEGAMAAAAGRLEDAGRTLSLTQRGMAGLVDRIEGPGAAAAPSPSPPAGAAAAPSPSPPAGVAAAPTPPAGVAAAPTPTPPVGRAAPQRTAGAPPAMGVGVFWRRWVPDAGAAAVGR